MRALVLLVSVASCAAAAPPPCDEAAIDDLRAALDASLDQAKELDFESWVETLTYPPRGLERRELKYVFQMLKATSDTFAEQFAGDVDLDSWTEEGRDVCVLYAAESGQRRNGGIRFTLVGERWMVYDFTWQARFLLRGPVEDGVSLSIKTPGNQRVFKGVQPEIVEVKFTYDLEGPKRLPRDAISHVRFTAIPVENNARPRGLDNSPVPFLSAGAYDVPAGDVLGHGLPTGTFEVFASYESQQDGDEWWQGRVESNSLIIEIRP